MIDGRIRVKTPSSYRAGGVILAAGASTRLGQPKQLVRFRGGTLLEHVMHNALAAGCSPLIVVLGFDAERIAAALPILPTVELVRCENWAAGMGATLKAGLHALIANREEACDAALVLLCDQPDVSADFLLELLRVHYVGGAAAAASQYAGTLGPPAVFGRELFGELLASPDRVGAKAIIERYSAAGKIGRVEFPAGARDVDIPADLLQLDK